MSIRGSYSQLATLRQAIVSGAQGELRKRMLAAAANEAKTQVALGFRESRDPSGTAWAPLKVRKGMPLRDSGRLANSFTAVPTSAGFRVGTNVTYAKFHQYGTKGHKAHQQKRSVNKRGRFVSNRSVERALDRYTKKREDAIDAGKRPPRAPSFLSRTLSFKEGGGKIPARPMVPEGALTPLWATAINKAADVAFKNFFSRIAK